MDVSLICSLKLVPQLMQIFADRFNGLASLPTTVMAVLLFELRKTRKQRVLKIALLNYKRRARLQRGAAELGKVSPRFSSLMKIKC